MLSSAPGVRRTSAGSTRRVAGAVPGAALRTSACSEIARSRTITSSTTDPLGDATDTVVSRSKYPAATTRSVTFSVCAGTVNRPSAPVITRASPAVTVAPATGALEPASRTMPETTRGVADSGARGFDEAAGCAAEVLAIRSSRCAAVAGAAAVMMTAQAHSTAAGVRSNLGMNGLLLGAFGRIRGGPSRSAAQLSWWRGITGLLCKPI